MSRRPIWKIQAAALAHRSGSPASRRITLALALVVAGVTVFAQASSWKSAEPSRAFRFPADHASHPDYRIEWWYYTGNLKTKEGRRFGYQVTFFRVGVEAAPANPSRWAVRDLYMTHIALTDVAGKRHVSAERLNRAGVSWAGADPEAYKVWNERWSAHRDDQGRHVIAAGSASPAFSIDLTLEEGKRPVLQGDRGFSQKGEQAGNASYYYSLTRMPTRGVLTLDYRRYEVEGESWMDHEFGTSFLEQGQLGWDWFALQLDDGTELMLYGLRTAAGFDAHSSATLVARDGSTRSLTREAFELQPGRTWRSPSSGGTYPVAWRVRVPEEQVDLRVTAALEPQEMHSGLATQLAYWEGAVTITGTKRGAPVTGRGYLEMTGYAGPPLGQFLETKNEE
jgi:predicted secreted hydrolase